MPRLRAKTATVTLRHKDTGETVTRERGGVGYCFGFMKYGLMREYIPAPDYSGNWEPVEIRFSSQEGWHNNPTYCAMLDRIFPEMRLEDYRYNLEQPADKVMLYLKCLQAPYLWGWRSVERMVELVEARFPKAKDAFKLCMILLAAGDNDPRRYLITPFMQGTDQHCPMYSEELGVHDLYLIYFEGVLRFRQRDFNKQYGYMAGYPACWYREGYNPGTVVEGRSGRLGAMASIRTMLNTHFLKYEDKEVNLWTISGYQRTSKPVVSVSYKFEEMLEFIRAVVFARGRVSFYGFNIGGFDE